MSQLTLKSLLMSAFICDFERVSGLKKASEAWIQGFCVTTVWGWHRLWQAGKDFCHFWYSAYVIFVILLTSTIFIFQLKMLHKKHSKGGFPAPKNIKNILILDPLTPAKKNYTCTAYMLHVTNIGYGPQSTFINVAKNWFWQFCCKMLTFAGDDTLKLLPAWGAAYALKL